MLLQREQKFPTLHMRDPGAGRQCLLLCVKNRRNPGQAEPGLCRWDSSAAGSTGAAESRTGTSPRLNHARCCRREQVYARRFVAGADVTPLCSVSVVVCSALCAKTVPGAGPGSEPEFGWAVGVQAKARASQCQLWGLLWCFDHPCTANREGSVPERTQSCPTRRLLPPQRN